MCWSLFSWETYVHINVTLFTTLQLKVSFSTIDELITVKIKLQRLRLINYNLKYKYKSFRLCMIFSNNLPFSFHWICGPNLIQDIEKLYNSKSKGLSNLDFRVFISSPFYTSHSSSINIQSTIATWHKISKTERDPPQSSSRHCCH